MMTIEELVAASIPFLVLMILVGETLLVLVVIFWLVPELVAERERVRRGLSRLRRRLGGLFRLLRRGARWLLQNLVLLVSLALLVILGAQLYPLLIEGGLFGDGEEEARKRLYLVLAVIALAALAQLGPRLLPRLRKVGPLEFVEESVKRIEPELERFESLVQLLDNASLFEAPPGGEKVLYEYEKTDRYLTHLKWSGLRDSELRESSRLHDLLFIIGTVALLRNDWLRAIDRFELLIELSKGEYAKKAEAFSRCGYSHLGLSIALTERLRELARRRATLEKKRTRFEEERLKKLKQVESEIVLTRRQHAEHRDRAHEHLSKAVRNDPHNSQALMNLAYVQVDLKAYELARKNNEKAIESSHDLAVAKYNLAICHVFLGDYESAVCALERIERKDRRAAMVIKAASKDEELAPLLEDPHFGPRARRFLRFFEISAGNG